MEKKGKSQYSDASSNAVGKEIEPITGSRGHKVFLHQFGEGAKGYADEKGQDDGLFSVCQPVGGILLAIAPKAGKGEARIHEQVHPLVEPDNWLDARKQRTRKSGQNQDDDSA